MRRHAVTVIALFPLLVGLSYADQNWSVEKPGGESWVFSSEDSGTSSYLGVDIADITTERLSALKLKEEKGVEVTMVDQGRSRWEGWVEGARRHSDHEWHCHRKRGAASAHDS